MAKVNASGFLLARAIELSFLVFADAF